MRNFFPLKHKYQVSVPWGPFHHHLLYTSLQPFLGPLHSLLSGSSRTEFSFFLIHPLTLASGICLPDVEDLVVVVGGFSYLPTILFFCVSSPSILYVYVSQSVEDVACPLVGPPPWHCWGLSYDIIKYNFQNIKKSGSHKCYINTCNIFLSY